MFCPKCECEYREGFDTCADCGVALVEDLPKTATDEADHEPPEVVLEEIDPAKLAVARSVLRGAGIEFAVEKEEAQDLLGAGRLGGVSPLVGPSRILVKKPDAETARRLLAEAPPAES